MAELIDTLVENPAANITDDIQTRSHNLLATANEVDEEAEAELLVQAVLDVLTVQAAREVAAQMSKVDSVVSAIFFIFFQMNVHSMKRKKLLPYRFPASICHLLD